MIDRDLLYGLSADDPQFVALRLAEFLTQGTVWVERARDAVREQSARKLYAAVHELSKTVRYAGVAGLLRNQAAEAHDLAGLSPLDARLPQSPAEFYELLDAMLVQFEIESVEARRLLKELES